MHPHQHTATAWAWHLSLALGHLEQLAAAEQAAARTEWATAHDGVRSWQPSTGRSQGAHGDPVASAVATAGSRPRLGFTLLASNTTELLWWLCGALDSDAVRRGRALEAIAARIPRLRPSAAGELVKHLVERDQVIRARTFRAPDWRPVEGTPACPACRNRVLRGAPGVVLCDCVCAGAGCGCGMAVREQGAPHAWAWGAVAARAA